MNTFCHKCGTEIKHTYRWFGNIYGSECIQAVSSEQMIEGLDGIDFNSLIIGLRYSRVKEINVEDFIKNIPRIGSRIRQGTSNFYDVVIGYNSTYRKNSNRKKKEFAIVVKAANRVYCLFTEYVLLKMQQVQELELCDATPIN